jgi:uncharacterized protein YyaL (SSP411 family)
LDDYAYLACGLLTLYESCGESRYLEQAVGLVDVVLARFVDAEQGGFFFTADDQEKLLVRNKEFADNAVPSSNGMAALALVRLAKLTGEDRYLTAAETTMQACVELMKRYPSGTAQMLIAVELFLGPTYELVLASDDREESQEVLKNLQRRYLPNTVLGFAADEPPQPLAELLQGKAMLGGVPTLYVCEGFTCQAPAQGKEEIAHALDALTPQGIFSLGK